MQRLVALIAVIFSFATIAGSTTAYAHRYISTPIVVLNMVDAENVSIPVTVSVQRGEIDLGSGIIMPFGSLYAITVDGQVALPPAERDAPTPNVRSHLPFGMAERLLRPPRAA
ncbi:hypothetical protein [Devosia sp. FJ2-5-3]|jgi:hypothetical protein|uniref:hypothetical protein n=1 Tax=Devosia sp. FJ2-5-3 TaxID=2976680 RepID=UPI0023D841ED|nr:hypothetical protein [Devosia sp. FJ2-5-3]WEJ58437.1 hypothetical protein N0P34_20085 [Devosia sp. FJ2-5-3]